MKREGDRQSIDSLLFSSASLLQWNIPFDDLALREQIGVGAGAEVHIASYRGADVAVKLLINQNFSEENNFTLRYLASTLSKLNHLNVVTLFGMCLDAPRIFCFWGEKREKGRKKIFK
jgi:hypothetical protein